MVESGTIDVRQWFDSGTIDVQEWFDRRSIEHNLVKLGSARLETPFLRKRERNSIVV